jgi:hypothetical protein
MEERKFEPLGSVEVINILPGYVRRQPSENLELRAVEPQRIAAITLEDLYQRLMCFIKEQPENDEDSSQ